VPVETIVGDDNNGSVLHGGRISACSYRSYLSYDELAPDSLLDDQLSLVSGRTSTTPGPNIALVTPGGTLYRLSDPPPRPHGALAGRDTGAAPEGLGASAREGDLSPGVVSAELDDVFLDEDEDEVTSANDVETSSTSVFDFAMACLRRQRPDKTAVVSTVRSTNSNLNYLNFICVTCTNPLCFDGVHLEQEGQPDCKNVPSVYFTEGRVHNSEVLKMIITRLNEFARLCLFNATTVAAQCHSQQSNSE